MTSRRPGGSAGRRGVTRETEGVSKAMLTGTLLIGLGVAVLPFEARADGETAPSVRREAKRPRVVQARRTRVASRASDAYVIQDKPGFLDEYLSGPEARCKYVFGVPFAFCGRLQEILPDARGPKLVGTY